MGNSLLNGETIRIIKNMKKTLFTILLSLITVTLFAQIENHVSWKSHISKEEASIGEEIELIFEANIDKDWYLYSSDFDPDLGPMLTEFSFEENNSFELIGDIKAINPKRKYDSLIWDGEYTYFTKKGEFRQKVKVLSENFEVKVAIMGQTCSDIDGKCILFNQDFTLDQLKVTPAKKVNSAKVENTEEVASSKIKETENSKTESTEQSDKINKEKTEEAVAKN